MLRPVGGKRIEATAGDFIDVLTIGCDDAEFTEWVEDEGEDVNQSTPQTQAISP